MNQDIIQTSVATHSLYLDGALYTNSFGVRKLLQWYHEAKQYTEVQIHTCCRDLEWLDANLAALWSALTHKLENENGLSFYLDQERLNSRFSILLRNGFGGEQQANPKKNLTFIQNASFGPDAGDQFTEYIENELLAQREIQSLPIELRGMLGQNLEELYMNVFRHAATSEPFFVCGQYYPKYGQLVVSLVDLGQTFLPPIQNRTEGAVTTQTEAIEWALQGNSELGADGGGHALKCISQAFQQNGHFLQIVTGNGFWDSEGLTTTMGPAKTLPFSLPGTMVSLRFQLKPTGK